MEFKRSKWIVLVLFLCFFSCSEIKHNGVVLSNTNCLEESTINGDGIKLCKGFFDITLYEEKKREYESLYDFPYTGGILFDEIQKEKIEGCFNLKSEANSVEILVLFKNGNGIYYYSSW